MAEPICRDAGLKETFLDLVNQIESLSPAEAGSPGSPRSLKSLEELFRDGAESADGTSTPLSAPGAISAPSSAAPPVLSPESSGTEEENLYK